MRAYASIFVPDFPMEALLRAAPELRSQAVAALEGKAPLQKVFSLNAKARRAGVETGMTKLQVEACTGLVLHPRSLLQEAAAHAALLDCAQSFSPQVEDSASDTVLLDLTGLGGLFGPLPQIAQALADRATALGLESNVALASNPDTALLAARGFSGVTVIPVGNEAQRLGNLPLEILFGPGFPAKEAEQFLETFNRWGIRDLRALAALPEISLSERLGQAGLRLQKLARGVAQRTLVPVGPSSVFEEAMELDHPLVLLEPLAFLLSRLLEQLCARLSAHALATQELHLRLELESGWHSDIENADHMPVQNNIQRIFSRTLRLPVPLIDPKVFLKLLQLDLKAHPPGAPIAKVFLTAVPARPRAAQSGLFLPPSPEPEKLELTLARIAEIVGKNKAGSIELLDTHRPEGFRMLHFTAENKKTPALQDNHADLVTALRIFRPPVHATITVRDGKPARLSCHDNTRPQGEIFWAAGPWRSSGDWWEKEAWARDEWDIAVQAETGATLYRLVRDLLGGNWLIEGTYD